VNVVTLFFIKRIPIINWGLGPIKLIAVIANTFCRTACHSFFYSSNLIWICWLFENVGIPGTVIASNVIRRTFTAKITVSALRVYVKFAYNI